MARKSFSNNSRYELELVLSQQGQSVVSNASDVSMSVRMIKTSGSGYYSNSSHPYSVYLDGTLRGSGSTSYNFTKYSVLTLWTGRVSIKHNADGTRYVSGYATFNAHSSIGSATVYADLSLTRIPRKSDFSVPASFFMGNPLPINISRASTSFTHIVKLIGPKGDIFSVGNVGTSTTLTMTTAMINTLCSTIPNATEVALSVFVETWEGGTVIGSSYKTTIAKVPTNVLPSFGSKGIVTVKGGVAQSGLWDGTDYVDYVTFDFTVPSAVGMYGSTIKNVNVTGENYNTGLKTFSKAGKKKVTVTITDSRGRTATASITVTLVNIELPSIQVQYVRCDATGKVDPFGTYGKATGTITGNGSYYMYFLIKETGTTQWTTVVSKDWDNKNIPITSMVTLKGNLKFLDFMSNAQSPSPTTVIGIPKVDVTKSYDLALVLRHQLEPYSPNNVPMRSYVQDVLATTEVAMDIGTNNIAIGGIYTAGRGSVDSKGQMYQNDGKKVLDIGAVADYVIEEGSNKFGRYTKWASGKLECIATCSWGNSAATAYGYVFYYGCWIQGTNNGTWTFPHPFIDHAISVHGSSTGSAIAQITPDVVTAKSADGFWAYRFVNTFQWKGYSGIVTAVGRWK